MPDVAFVLPDFRRGGAETVALAIIKDLLEHGHSVDLVLLRQRGALLDSLPADVRVFDLGADRIRQALWPLVRYLRKRRPKAIQARLWPVTIVAILAHRLARVGGKLIVSDHGILSRQYRSRWSNAAVRLTTRLFYPLAHGRVVVSRGAAADTAMVSGMPVGSFTILHNPLQLPAELRLDPNVERIWKDSRLRILSVGILKPVKNQALLIRSLARIPSKLDPRLVIAGDGQLKAELERLCDEVGVADRVHFAGNVSDPWPLYASAQVFALSSDEESFGNVLVEALHAGLPIVSTATVGATEILEEGRFGTLLSHPTPDAFAAALVDAASRPPDKGSLKARARALSGPQALRAYETLLCP